MAAVKVGVNGFGRIGRNLFRAAHAAGVAGLALIVFAVLLAPLALAVGLLFNRLLRPNADGMPVLNLRRDIAWLMIANRTQHGDPVQEFSSDVAGF